MKDIYICVVAGTHGDEYGLGKMVQDNLADRLPNQVFNLVGNPMAVYKNVRYIDEDLNRSFDLKGNGYEVDRASEITEIIEKEGFTHVFDIHTSPSTTDIVPIFPGGCEGVVADEIVNKLSKAENVVNMPDDNSRSSLVGSFGLGGVGLECPQYEQSSFATLISDGIENLIGQVVCPKLVRAVYDIDGIIPTNIELPNGELKDFDLIPELGGFAFVPLKMYKEKGYGHQGLRASERYFREI